MIDFSNKKALLIEDMAEARILQKKMLTDFGFKSIEVAMKAESAIELLKTHKYDVVLSDYNLGNGKDGQQLLEEVRHSGLIPNTSTYLMVTAETSIEMVMGAIEYQPDGYITKPFSQALLQRRLGKLLESKEKLKSINKALDAKDYQVAIDSAYEIIKQAPYLEGKCLRIICECLIELKQFDKAQKLYLKTLKDRKMPWALFGYAKTLYYKEDYPAAESKFRQLTLDNKFFVNAYDWLAKCLVAMGQEENAQEVLILALTKSPKSILRQLELGKLSMHLKDYIMAEMSFRRAVFLAKHSCFNDPQIYLNHLRAIAGIASDGDIAPRNKDSFKNTLKKIEQLFPDNQIVNTEKYEVEVDFYVNTQQKSQANSTLSLWKQDAESGRALPPGDDMASKIDSIS